MFQLMLYLMLLVLKVDSACRDSDYRTTFGNPAYATVYDETAFVAIEDAMFVAFNFQNGVTNYQIIYKLNLEGKKCEVQWEKNLKLADAKIVSLAVDESEKILAALVKDVGSSKEMVYRFYTESVGIKDAGQLINAHPTGLNSETVLLQALMPSTTTANFFFVLREASLDKLNFEDNSFIRLEYSESSKTLDAKHFDGSLYLARYDQANDIIEFEEVPEDFSEQGETFSFSPMFQANTQPLSTYATANARLAVIKTTSVFLFSCVNVDDDSGASQDVVFSRIDWNTGQLLTRTVLDNWANCIVGASTQSDSASFLMKDKDFFYFASVKFDASDVIWRQSQEWEIFANGVKTFETYGQYLKTDKKEDWFFVGLSNEIASAQFNYNVGVVVSTEDHSRLSYFWDQKFEITPTDASMMITSVNTAHTFTTLTLFPSTPIVEDFKKKHPELAHNYWMKETTCKGGNQYTQRNCTYWEILEDLPDDKALSKRLNVPNQLKDCDWRTVFFPSDDEFKNYDDLHAACFPKIIQNEDTPFSEENFGNLVVQDLKGEYFKFGKDWTSDISPTYFWLKYGAEYDNQFSKELVFLLTIAKNTYETVIIGQDWVYRPTQGLNDDQIKNFNVTCWSEECPDWVYINEESRLFTVKGNETKGQKSWQALFAYEMTYNQKHDCNETEEVECEDYFEYCDWEEHLEFLEEVTDIEVIYNKTDHDQDFKALYKKQCDKLEGYSYYTEWRNEHQICSLDLLTLCDTLQYPWIYRKETLLVEVKSKTLVLNINKPYEIWYKNHKDDKKLHKYQPTAPVEDPRKNQYESNKKQKKKRGSKNQQKKETFGKCDACPDSWTEEVLQTAYFEAVERSTSSEAPVTTKIEISETGLIKLVFNPPLNLPSYMIKEENEQTPTPDEVQSQADVATAASPTDSGRLLQDEVYFEEVEEVYYEEVEEVVEYYEAVEVVEYYEVEYVDVEYYYMEYFEEEVYLDECLEMDSSGQVYLLKDCEEEESDDEDEDDEDDEDDVEYYCPNENDYWEWITQSCEPFQTYIGEFEDMIQITVLPDPSRGDDLEKAMADTSFTYQFLSVNKTMIQLQTTFVHPERVSLKDKLVVSMQKFVKFDRSFKVEASDPNASQYLQPQLTRRDEDLGAAVGKASSLAKGLVAMTLVAQLAMNGALSQIWGMLHGLQFLIHLPTLSVEFPNSVKMVLEQIISIATFDIPYVDVPTIQGSYNFNAEGIKILSDIKDEEYYEVLYNSVSELGYSSPFSSDTMGSSYIFSGIGVILCGFACILFCLRRRFPRLLNSLYRKLENTFFWGFFIRLFFEINIEQSYIAIMNIRYGNFFTFPKDTEYGFGAVINFFVAVVWIAGFVGVPLFLTVFFWIPPFQFEKLQTTWWKKRFGALVAELELARYTIAYLVLFTVRRTLFAFVAIDMAWCLWAQLFIHSVFTILACCLLLQYRIFQDDLIQRLEVFNEVIVLSTVGVIFGLKLTEDDSKERLGIVYLSLLFFNLFIHFSLLLKGVAQNGIKSLLILYQKRLIRKRGYKSVFVEKLIKTDFSICKKRLKTSQKQDDESEPVVMSGTDGLKKKQYKVLEKIEEVEEKEEDKTSGMTIVSKAEKLKLRLDEQQEDLKNWQLGPDRKVPNLFFDLDPNLETKAAQDRLSPPVDLSGLTLTQQRLDEREENFECQVPLKPRHNFLADLFYQKDQIDLSKDILLNQVSQIKDQSTGNDPT